MPKSKRIIEILAFPGVQVLDVTGPLQVFSTANDLCEAVGGNAPYELIVVAKAETTRSSSGLALVTIFLPTGEAPDTLILAGGPGVNAACEDIQLLSWITARAAGTRRVTSVCSGAFLLGACGLLDGRRAVTHWGRCAEFAKRFPLVKLDVDPIFVQDENIWTSAGVTSGIDLALALVEQDLGRPLALAVARQLVVFFKRPGGQAQFSATLTLQDYSIRTADSRLERLLAWIADNLCADLSLRVLADRTGMSTRSFSRNFKSATGATPAAAVERIRLEAARRMLEQGGTVKRVSHLCGFGSEETLRRSFLRNLGVTPQSYMRNF